MLTKQNVQLREFFYPIGNTPAVNLLRDVPNRSQPRVLEILSLGCGDPRSVLFTLNLEDALSSPPLHFTCCDKEPAILARNVLLLTLMADQSDAAGTALWNIFYHVFVPDSEMTIIQRQAQQLAELAVSLESWSASQYGSWARFLDEDTCDRVHKVWLEYAETAGLTKKQMKSFETRGRSGVESMHRTKVSDRGIRCCAYRSAGPHAVETCGVLAEAHRIYWATGVVGGNKRDVAALGHRGSGRVNPLFSVSSASNGDFAVHYASDPLMSFYFAQAFDSPDSVKDPNVIDQVVNIAKAEFGDWCRGFRHHLEASCGLVLSFYCGEAVRLCYELQARNPGINNPPTVTGLYKDCWSAAPMDVLHTPEGATGFFDVIDTSNIVDHVGMLNVLPAVVPLVRRRSSSVLYTESLLRHSEDVTSYLNTILCCDAKTMSLLLGIAPMPYLTGVSVESYVPDLAMYEGRQFRFRVPWRVLQALSEPSDTADGSVQILKPTFEPDELADYFFRLYLTMFEHEAWSRVHSPAAMIRALTLKLAGELRYYNRMSLALLVAMIKSNVDTDWQECSTRLLDKIEDDRSLIIGTNSLQELLLHFHVLGLSPDPTINHPPRSLHRLGMLSPSALDAGLLGSPSVPPIAYLALVVPRSTLSIFTAPSPDQTGTPGLLLSIRYGLTLQNSYHPLQLAFGRIYQTGHLGHCAIAEDPAGWGGSSDLIAVCQIPLFALLLGPRSVVRVGLVVEATSSTAQFFDVLGPTNTVFETGLTDTTRLHLLREPPFSWPRSPRTVLPPPPSPPRSTARITLDAYSRATSATARAELAAGTAASQALRAGAAVSTVSTSPCAATVRIGGDKAVAFSFPYPINGRALRLRVARQSSWVEVSAALAEPLGVSGRGENLFPVIRAGGSAWFSVGLPRVALDRLPAARVQRGEGWLERWLGAAFSTQELQSARPLACLKRSLLQVFVEAAGNARPIHLRRPGGMGCDGSIVPVAIRHDVEAASVVLDGYFVPVIDPKALLVDAKLLRLSEEEHVL